MKRRLVVLLDFLTIIKILWRQTEEYVYAQSWTEWFFLQENASSLSVVGCLCRVQWQLTDRPSSDMGRARLEPRLCSLCMVLLTAQCYYHRDPRMVILIHKQSFCHQKGIIAPSRWLWSGCVDTCLQTGCSHIPYCGRVNGFLKITVMIFASKAGTKLLFFFFFCSNDRVQPLDLVHHSEHKWTNIYIHHEIATLTEILLQRVTFKMYFLWNASLFSFSASKQLLFSHTSHANSLCF